MRSVHPMRTHWWEKVQKSGSVSLTDRRIERRYGFIPFFVSNYYIFHSYERASEMRIYSNQALFTKKGSVESIAGIYDFAVCRIARALSFQNRKSFMLKTERLESKLEREQLFRIDPNIFYLIVRRSRSLLILYMWRESLGRRLFSHKLSTKCVIVRSIWWWKKWLVLLFLSFDLFANVHATYF